jgi:formylglycine-generating enzyme required for sulfatase activity
MKTDDDWQKADCPSLRGGSWGVTADDARASFRNWDPPDVWYVYVGFRVVLSLAASQNPET